MKRNDEPAMKSGRINSSLRRLAQLPRLIRDGWQEDMVALRNWWRRQRGARVEFVVMRLSGPLPERSGPPRSFFQRQLPLPSPPLTIQVLNDRLQRIADAENVRGVLFILGDLSMIGIARLQNVRRSLMRLREAGKEVVVYSPFLDLAHYYIASAASRIVVPPGSQFDVIGLHSEAIFLRDALQKVGIEAEVLQVSPYKTAGNMLAESAITPEQQRQMEWLIDDTYDAITADVAEARSLSQEDVKALIDSAPFSVEKAHEVGLVDTIAYEDELPGILAVDRSESTGQDATENGERAKASSRREGATLLTWSKARPLLMEKARRPSPKIIGVISLDGVIVMGESRQPPVKLPIPLVGGAMSGEETLVQLLRRAERDNNTAALILHVESGGGSSLASELIWRQVTRVCRKKPVVAYMGDVAASGGYFVSAGAAHIMSQRSTLTGSIGVLIARMNAEGLFEKLSVNRAGINRGAHAGIYSEARPLRPEERELLWRMMQDTYDDFKAVVTEARNLSPEQLEEVAGGRVWTGRQAKERGLVDDHGDFVAAVHKAAELSGVADDDEQFVRVENLYARDRAYIPPQPADAIQHLEGLLSLSIDPLRSLNGHTLLMMPYELHLF